MNGIWDAKVFDRRFFSNYVGNKLVRGVFDISLRSVADILEQIDTEEAFENHVYFEEYSPLTCTAIYRLDALFHW